MIKRKVSYEDYDGNRVEETLYFNLTKFEATEIALTLPEPLSKALDDNALEKDKVVMAQGVLSQMGSQGVIDFIKNIVLKSYGVKNPNDGRRFMKSQALSEEFSQTEAFSELMMNLLTNEEDAADFVNGLISARFAEKV